MMWIILGLLALYVVFALLIDRGRDDQAPFDARESRHTPLHTNVHANGGSGAPDLGGASGGGGDSSG